jgi:L-alanine-DL-glutamate epimerase-like enolase superfamily enzyme
MKIVGLQTNFVTVPFEKAEVWAWGRRPGISAMLIELHTDEGMVGCGECVLTHSSFEIMQLIAESAKRFVIGETPFNVEKIARDFYGLTGWHFQKIVANHVFAGIEIALWDLIGKSSGKPLYQLLGGGYRDAMTYSVYITRDKPEVMSKEAQKYLELGYTTFDVKLGIDPKNDIEIVGTVRDAIGSDAELRVDANQMWSPGRALRNIKKLERYDLQYVEQPVPATDLNSMAMLRKRTAVPIAADESASTLQDVHNIIAREAADVILLDARKMGGLLACKKAAAAAEAAERPVVMHTSGELGVAATAFAHVVVSTPNFIMGNQCLYQYLTDDILPAKLTIERNRLRLSDSPGLGVTPDMSKVSRYSHMYAQGGVLSHYEPLSEGRVPVSGSW